MTTTWTAFWNDFSQRGLENTGHTTHVLTSGGNETPNPLDTAESFLAATVPPIGACEPATPLRFASP